jgi:hypothetical protein
MKYFLQDVLNFQLGFDFAPVFKDGRMTIVNKSMATLQMSGQNYSGDLALTGDFTCAGRRKQVTSVGGHTDFSGVNRKYITEDGRFDASAAMADFATGHLDKRLYKETTMSIISSQPQEDSHEAFLYNMLVSWVKALLYRVQGGKDKVLRVKTAPYCDSHCVVPLDQGPDEHTYEINLGPPVDLGAVEAPEIRWQARGPNNFWDRPFVLYYSTATRGQESFYLYHVLGRTNTSALNCDVAIPALDTSALSLMTVQGNCRGEIDAASVPWGSDAVLWSWIIDYVKLNRVEQQFAAAFETIASALFHPQPSSMEACWWYKSAIHVALGEFSPVRARVPSCLTGEPYVPSARTAEFMFNEAASPQSLLVASAMGNYYMWYGLYTLLTEYAGESDEWPNVFTSVRDDLLAMAGPSMRASTISLLTGQEVPSCMTMGAHMNIVYAHMVQRLTLATQVSLDGAEPVTIHIHRIPAPVSGALLLGTVVGDLPATVHLTAVKTINMSGDKRLSNKGDVLALTSILRMLGQDVRTTCLATHEQQFAWANVRECVVEPNSIGYWQLTSSCTYPLSSEARQGRHFPVPPVEDIMRRGECIIKYDRPTLVISDWQQWREASTRSANQMAPVKAHKFLVKAPYVMNPVVFHAKQVFQEVPVELKTLPAQTEAMRTGVKVDVRASAPTAAPTSLVRDAGLSTSKSAFRPMSVTQSLGVPSVKPNSVTTSLLSLSSARSDLAPG